MLLLVSDLFTFSLFDLTINYASVIFFLKLQFFPHKSVLLYYSALCLAFLFSNMTHCFQYTKTTHIFYTATVTNVGLLSAH